MQVLDVELHLSPEGTDLIILGVAVVTESPNNELKIQEILKSIPTKLWCKTIKNVGLLVSAQPVNIKTKGRSPPPAVKQYPIPQEAEKNIQKQIDQYLA